MLAVRFLALLICLSWHALAYRRPLLLSPHTGLHYPRTCDLSYLLTWLSYTIFVLLKVTFISFLLYLTTAPLREAMVESFGNFDLRVLLQEGAREGGGFQSPKDFSLLVCNLAPVAFLCSREAFRVRRLSFQWLSCIPGRHLVRRLSFQWLSCIPGRLPDSRRLFSPRP